MSNKGTMVNWIFNRLPSPEQKWVRVCLMLALCLVFVAIIVAIFGLAWFGVSVGLALATKAAFGEEIALNYIPFFNALGLCTAIVYILYALWGALKGDIE